MYCFTYANSMNCIFRELTLWSDISSEHPIFIKTVAELSGIKLPEDIIQKLLEVHKSFSNLNLKIKKPIDAWHLNYSCTMRLRCLIEEFITYDIKFIKLFKELDKYGKENKVFMELLNHIHHEQIFMYKLFNDLLMQIG